MNNSRGVVNFFIARVKFGSLGNIKVEQPKK